jgi:hypothetical protein
MTPLHFRSAKIKFEPRDLWIGVYWNYKNKGHAYGKWQREFSVYICFCPTLPIIFEWHS